MPYAVGTKLGSYEILAPIASGGMGDVYRAQDTKLGREVAIKILPEAFAQDKERLARFEREAHILASLNHPNIATIHGLEEFDEVHFLVLEYVPGETLAERISQGPIPVDEALPLFKQIAEGMEAAHEKGIIHRDLKPANIKITPDGKVKVLDFGLAKAFGSELGESSQSESPTLTRQRTETGVILGTAPYMSPEQARGKPVDKRTDIWSFGCVLYEALTGTAAFLGDTVSDTLARILEREPNWELLPPTTPTPIRSLLRRCLQKEPLQRLRDIGDARLEIEETLTLPPESPRAVAGTAPRRKANLASPFILMALVTVISAAVALWSLLRSGTPVARSVTRTTIPLPPGDALVLSDTPAVAISPNGRRVAYVARRSGATQLYLRSMDQPEAHPGDGSEGAKMPFFSPDSQWVGFLASGNLMKASVSGGAPVTLSSTGQNVRGASWGPDGRIVLSPGTSAGLARISEDGGEPEVLTNPDRGRGEKTHRFPEVLPGGKAILFTIGTGDITSFDDASIAVLSLETGEYRVLVEGGTNARYSTTGHLVYARAGSLLAVPFDLNELRVKGAPTPILHGVTISSVNGPAEFSVSRDGSLIYAPGDSRGDNHRVLWVDREGQAQPLIETPRGFYLPRLSPDGRLLALNISGANGSVWVYDLHRSSLARLTFSFDNDYAIWTPDSRRVTFGSTREGPWNLFWQTADGSAKAERIVPSEHRQQPASWSPNGKVLAFEEFRPETGRDIWILAREDDRKPEPFLKTEFNEGDPMFSPGGRWIAYVSDESGQYEVYVRPFPSSERKFQVSTEGGTPPVWNPGGRELFYRNGDKMMVVDIETKGDLTLGKPRLLFERRSPGWWGLYFDVAPDGQRFVMIDDSEAKPAPTQLNLVLNWSEELKRLAPNDN